MIQTMIKKRNWLLIILCAYYFFYSLKSLVDTVISFMVIRTGHVNNTDALYVNNYFFSSKILISLLLNNILLFRQPNISLFSFVAPSLSTCLA